MKTRIHVNRQVLGRNHKQGLFEPAVTAKNYKANRYGHRVDILAKDGTVVASVLQSRKPLSCGAKVWIETDLPVRVTEEKDDVADQKHHHKGTKRSAVCRI